MSKEVAQTAKSGVIAQRTRGVLAPHFQNPAELPTELKGLFDIKDWVRALMTGEKYTELNPDFMAQRMMMLTLSATTVEEVLADEPMEGLQNLIPDAPWMGTGNITLTGLYVARSELENGAPTYMLLEYVREDRWEEVTTTTGATKLQLQFASMLAMGIWPIRGQIKRTDRKDRGGRHLFSFYPPED